jgi:hypothetical protein
MLCCVATLAENDRRFAGAYCLHHQGGGDCKHLWNVGQFLPDYAAQRRWKLSSCSPPWVATWILTVELTYEIWKSWCRCFLGLNVVVEWLTLLHRIRVVPGSNIRPEIGYPDWSSSWFFSVTPGNCRDLKISPRPLPSKSFSIHRLGYHFSFDAV